MDEASPASLLKNVFEHISATRMSGLPILNPALQVDVVGMRPWEGKWVGVLISPWTISLALLPGKVPLKRLGSDEKAVWDFPSGRYEFMGIEEPGLGVCHLCSLISPVAELSTQDEAVNVAEAVISELMQAPAEADLMARDQQIAEVARMRGESLVRQEISRRGFLRGAFLKN